MSYSAHPSASAGSSVSGDRRAIGLLGAPWRRLALVVAVHSRAMELDRLLAAGAASEQSPAIAQRARMLTGRRSRRRLAAGLTRALVSARSDCSGFSAAVAPDARAVLAARPVLRALERRLGDARPIRAQGAAMLSILLTDGTSPLYRGSDPGALGSELRAAASSLDAIAR
ncbi:MAG: hypothetical protein WAK93_08195 [Solirubrobacteraceae bacterium]